MQIASATELLSEQLSNVAVEIKAKGISSTGSEATAIGASKTSDSSNKLSTVAHCL